MRLDYTLYGLAIVFFILTAVSFGFVAEQDGKNLWAVSTFVLGILSASAGYFLKPKVKTAVPASAPAAAPEVVSELTPQVTATVEPSVVESPQMESPQVETMTSSEVEVEAPDVAPTPVTSTVEPAAPNVEVPPTSSVSTIGAVDLTQVKGIGDKRAAQLKTNGVNSVEDLAKSDASDLAAKLMISPKIVEKWVAGAKKLIK